MSNTPPPEKLSETLHRLAGYMNFSSGASDPSIMAAWNTVFDIASAGDPLTGPAAWLVVKDWIEETLQKLQEDEVAFRDCEQASRLASLLWSELLPAYLDFHRDLLFHQVPEMLFNGFFMARAADALLAVGLRGDDQQVVRAAIDRLDDFVGYRPVAMLENRTCQPYRHEFVCPVPLYVKDAGISAGPYREIIELAIGKLATTADDVLRSASFDLERVEEIAIDPRAYDFDHPVNRRPNYHFGGWDERSISQDGFYHRFVLRQVTLDSLLKRAAGKTGVERREKVDEAACVLAGTMLMASGITGWGPGAYTSDITLGGLMKPIAAYRDAYYEDSMKQIGGEHAERLESEQKLRRQPFGAARQHLNAALAERRAAQLQHVQLARLYARMGYPDAAKRQTDTVSAASARMMCRIDCLMTLGLRAIRAGDLDAAVKVPAVAFDLMKRAIECGALIDPWDILANGGNFSLYAGPESGVHDSRVDDMLYLVEQVFGYTARVWSEAAARNDQAAYSEMDNRYREMAEWWRVYAAHTVESIEAADPLESYESAKLVARALRLWHEGGAEAGNVAFWAPHADLFDSPRAYALVISALLERRDFVPAMALLVHWLSNAERVGLRLGGSSLPRLSERWLLHLRQSASGEPDEFGESSLNQDVDGDTAAIWPLVRKMFDYFEANAEEFWAAPSFMLGEKQKKPRDWDRELTAADSEDGDAGEGLYDAAYEGVTYRDTTDDGNEGSVFGFGEEPGHDALEAESKRLIEHLNFMQSLARMWAVAADIAVADQDESDLQDRLGSLQSWAKRAKENRIGLLELLDSVREFPMAPAGTDKESMRSYDRRRVLRDSLMERIIGTAVEMSDSRRLISGALLALSGEKSNPLAEEEMVEDDAQAVRMFGALIASDQDRVRELFPPFLDALRDKNLLYIPISRGGDPVKIYVARLRQRVLRHLMHWLPRRGLLVETCRLIETAREMETSNPIGAGAVTEFDGLFRAGFRSLVASLVESVRQSALNDLRAAAQEDSTTEEIDASGSDDKQVQDERTKKLPQEEIVTGAGKSDDKDRADQLDVVQTSGPDEVDCAETLVPFLERVAETMLGSWLAHSQTLRLSPLESVIDPQKWKQLVTFVKDYGDPVFTQMFLQLGNVRAILHQGVSQWLTRAMEEGEDHLADTRLVEDLENGFLQVAEADRWMTLVYEALIDHHTEYLDYNSTTTQSDRGELVYMFLDFLRLRVKYERIAWNLKPVMWAHEVLVRSGLEKAAIMWRRSLSERIGAEADVYVQRLRQLQTEYAMRMPTVADRILERFVQPMTIDRMRALVGPAMRDAEENRDSRSFELLEQEAELLTRHPTGVGLDVPAWLDALEEEVEQLAKRRASSEIDPQSLMTISIVPLSLDELNEQLNKATRQGRRLPHMK